MGGNGHNSAWTLRGGEQRWESSWAASSKHLRLHTLQPLWPFPNIKRDGLCGRQFFGGICVVLGRQRYSTPCVSMLRIWQVAVKELYVFTEFMRLLGIQLFSIKSYFYCEVFLRLALEGGKATPAKAPSSTSPRSNLPREIWPSASVRTRGRDILVKSKTKILVKSLSRSPEVSPPGRGPTDWSLSPLLRVLLEIGFVPGRCRWEVSNRRMLPILRLGRGSRTRRGNGKRPVTDPGSSIMGRAGTKFAIVAKCDGLIITGL